MSFRRISYLKVYVIFCTVFIIYLLSSEWKNEEAVVRQNRKLHKVILLINFRVSLSEMKSVHVRSVPKVTTWFLSIILMKF